MYNSPFTVYYEGLATTGSTVYKYTLSNSSILFSGYRVICRSVATNATATVDLKKNGTLLYQIAINSVDSGEQSIPKISYANGDVFELSISSSSGNISGITFVFDVQVSYSVSENNEYLQTQTPLLFRYEGSLTSLNTSFYSYTADEQLAFFGYGIQLRGAADADVTVGVFVNGTQSATLLLPEGSLYVEGTMDFVVATGDVVSLKVLTTGSTNPGDSMIGYLNYRNLAQTVFSAYQTPFILEYEGLLNPTSPSFFRYTAPRDFTVFLMQGFLREVAISDVVFGLYQNGSLLASCKVLDGQTQSVVNNGSVISKAVSSGDLLEIKYISGTPVQGALITLDYSISVDESMQNYTFYSDPDSDIVLIARQLGIGGAKADALSLENLQKYKQDVDNLINSKASALYRTPFRKVQAGSNPWPDPIQFIAQRLVLRYILTDVYSEVEPNASSNIANQATIAEGKFSEVLNREFLLRGQTRRSRDYGSNPATEPLFVANPLAAPLNPNEPTT